MKIGSLFSGAGGLDMAVEHVFGAKTVWQCEFDAAASKVHVHALLAQCPDEPTEPAFMRYASDERYGLRTNGYRPLPDVETRDTKGELL